MIPGTPNMQTSEAQVMPVDDHAMLRYDTAMLINHDSEMGVF
jgi:hypothetical protein